MIAIGIVNLNVLMEGFVRKVVKDIITHVFALLVIFIALVMRVPRSTKGKVCFVIK